MPTPILYVSTFCYFCQKVLMFVRRHDVALEVRNTSDNVDRHDLIAGGGKAQVPCLRLVSEEGDQWMYESDDIIHYLRKHHVTVS